LHGRRDSVLERADLARHTPAHRLSRRHHALLAKRVLHGSDARPTAGGDRIPKLARDFVHSRLHVVTSAGTGRVGGQTRASQPFPVEEPHLEHAPRRTLLERLVLVVGILPPETLLQYLDGSLSRRNALDVFGSSTTPSIKRPSVTV